MVGKVKSVGDFCENYCSLVSVLRANKTSYNVSDSVSFLFLETRKQSIKQMFRGCITSGLPCLKKESSFQEHEWTVPVL